MVQVNRLLRTQLEEVQRQLRQANQQLDQAVTDNEKLHDDNLAETQQVKKYKKQVDQYREEKGLSNRLLKCEQDRYMHVYIQRICDSPMSKFCLISCLRSDCIAIGVHDDIIIITMMLCALDCKHEVETLVSDNLPSSSHYG